MGRGTGTTAVGAYNPSPREQVEYEFSKGQQAAIQLGVPIPEIDSERLQPEKLAGSSWSEAFQTVKEAREGNTVVLVSGADSAEREAFIKQTAAIGKKPYLPFNLEAYEITVIKERDPHPAEAALLGLSPEDASQFAEALGIASVIELKANDAVQAMSLATIFNTANKRGYLQLDNQTVPVAPLAQVLISLDGEYTSVGAESELICVDTSK